MYPATPSLSVEAVHVTVAPVFLTSDAFTSVGTLGASVSAAFAVVNVAASDFSDSFSAASTAVTFTLYSVDAVRPVRSYSVAVTSSAFTFVSFTYTLYPTTPTLSLASAHATLLLSL